MRDQLSTHQVITVVLPATDGRTLRIRKSSTPGRDPPRALPHPADAGRGHAAGEDLGPGAVTIVTTHSGNPLKYQHSAPKTVEVGLVAVMVAGIAYLPESPYVQPRLADYSKDHHR